MDLGIQDMVIKQQKTSPFAKGTKNKNLFALPLIKGEDV